MFLAMSARCSTKTVDEMSISLHTHLKHEFAMQHDLNLLRSKQSKQHESLAFDADTSFCLCKEVADLEATVCPTPTISVCDCIASAMSLFDWDEGFASRIAVCDAEVRLHINPLPHTYPRCYMFYGQDVIKEGVICSCPRECRRCS